MKASNFINGKVICIHLMVLIISVGCNNDLEDALLSRSDATHFTNEEMAILNQNLNLSQILDNYANQDLPEHYSGPEANESDNTPDNNPITDIGATLGRVLFYDPALSVNNRVSCASCHDQDEAFSDNRLTSRGVNGQRTRRHSMSLINAGFYENAAFFWDERALTLEEQVLMPIEDPTEMGLDLDDLSPKLQQLDYYPVLFNKAFGSPDVSNDKIAKALAQFVRSMQAGNSKFDRGLSQVWPVENEEEMPNFPNFTAEENMGIDIFYRGRNGATCLYCHGTPQHVNDIAKNNGLDLVYDDNGKGEITGLAEDMATFKVPSLRNIAHSAPYMHDGRFESLREVVDHYSDNVQNHPNLNFRLKTSDDPSEDAEVLRLNFNETEKQALVAFLNTLTDDTFANDPKFSDPFR